MAGLLVALLTSTGGAEDFGGFAVVAFERQLECSFMEDERSGMHIGTGLDLPPQRQRGGHGFKLSRRGNDKWFCWLLLQKNVYDCLSYV